MINIEIEKIADSIRPKESISKSRSTRLNDNVILARDIKDLAKRREHILKLKEGAEGYDEASQKGVAEELREFVRDMLVAEYQKELILIDDLLILTKIVTDYTAIHGANARQLYLYKAQKGLINRDLYREKYFYTSKEFERILNLIIEAIEDDSQRQPIAGKNEKECAIEANNQQQLGEKKIEKEWVYEEIALYCYYDGNQPNKKTLMEFNKKTRENALRQIITHYNIFKNVKKRLLYSGSDKERNNRLNKIKKVADALKEKGKRNSSKMALDDYEKLKEDIEGYLNTEYTKRGNI